MALLYAFGNCGCIHRRGEDQLEVLLPASLLPCFPIDNPLLQLLEEKKNEEKEQNRKI